MGEDFDDLDRFRGEVNRFAIEMTNEQPRSAAILGATFLEHAVKVAINVSLHVQDGISKQVFDGGTPLSRNVVLAYSLGVFGADHDIAKKIKKEIETIAKIRNKFAHGLEVRAFDHPEVVDLCDNLMLAESDFDGNLRAKYIASIKAVLSILDEFIRVQPRQ